MYKVFQLKTALEYTIEVFFTILNLITVKLK